MITVKNPQQIALMRESCKIVKETLQFVGENIKAGMTTKEVDELVHRYIISCGATPSSLGYCGFPASCCVSVNEVVVHGIPSDRVLLDGDIVSVDITVEKNGWQGDACRTFLIGNVSEEKKKLVKVTEECFFKAIENLKAGTPLYDIGYAVQTHAESHGYGVVRALTGHGIGQEMHEDPSVPNYGKKGTGMRLRAGMTICIEPMINMGTYKVVTARDGWTVLTADGKCAAHYENTVLITEDGVEILTL
ncbi:MAG: type I methionyl aminopeptidase [Clostridiales bacterium]|nr:type I methionyl aminopeptidase [Clostridiales bacterium]